MKYIEGGWESYRKILVQADAPEIQISECRQAFFSGAAILFSTIMKILDPGAEPTKKDVQTMSDIQKELDEFGNSLDKKYLGGKPN